MDHAKIEAVLKGLEIFDPDLSIAQANVTERASDLIRDLRTECDNQATKIVDLEENAEAIPEMMAALEECAAPFSTSPGSISQCQAEVNKEFERRLNIASRGLAVLKKVKP